MLDDKGHFTEESTGIRRDYPDVVTWADTGTCVKLPPVTKRAVHQFKIGDLITVHEGMSGRTRNDLVTAVDDDMVTKTQSGGRLPSDWKVEPAVTGTLNTKADKVIRVNRDWVLNGAGRPFIVQIGDVEAQFDTVTPEAGITPRTGTSATGRFANFVTSGPLKVGYTDSAAKPVAETTMRTGC